MQAVMTAGNGMGNPTDWLRGLLGALARARRGALGSTFEKVMVLSATHAVSGALVLVTFVMLANKLGPSLYGEFTFADSVLFLAILCASLGTEYVGNREVARSADARELVSGILILRTLASFAAAAIIAAWSLVFIDSPTLLPFMLVCSGVLLTVPGIAGWYFLARHRIRIVAAATLAREALFFVPVAFILDLVDDPGARLLYAGVFYLASRVVFAAVFLARLLMECGFTLDVKSSTYRYIMKDSAALLYASLVSSVTISVQIYMLKYLGEDLALGVYGAVFKQIFYIQLISLSFIMVFFPMLSKAWVEDRERYARLASALSELTLVVVVPVAMTGLLFPDYILGLLFTKEYASGGLALQLLSLSLIPMSFVRVLTTGILISMDMTTKMYSLVNIAFVGSLVSGLLIPALPSADAGAAASRLASECLFVAVSYAAVSGRVRVLAPAALTCILPGVGAMVVARALVPQGHEGVGMAACYLVFFAVYAGTLYLTRAGELRAALAAGHPARILTGRDKT